MRLSRILIVLSVTSAVAACAPSVQGTSDGISRLERQRASQPNNAQVQRALGIAYFKAARYDDARTTLELAHKSDPRDGTTALYLGLTAEQQNDLPAAREAYSSYVKYGRTARVRKQLEDRLAALSRKEVAMFAKGAIAQEKTLSGTPGNPRTIAVLPLKFTGPDTSLAPLERGMAELITTDLSRSSQLTVVERARLQALLDEVQLQQGGAVDQSTTVRTGKLIQAGRMVSGSILQTGGNIRVDAAVINVADAGVSAGTSDDRSLDQIFTIEKNIVLGLFQQMGITLTTAERNQIELRPTRSLAAFLAYSRGLKLEDQGKYDEARMQFRDAVRIDPNFGSAQQKSTEAAAVQQGAQVTSTTVEASLKGTSEGSVVNAAAQGASAPASSSSSGVGSTASSTAEGLNPSVTSAAAGAGTTSTSVQAPAKDPAAAGTGTDNVSSKTAKVVIVIKAPKP
ncbi:MAG: hypothetical protein JWO05_636 [Gemmatimonadetes bacterium]|nr:hypothetical protein [Gemmatimonadota bacterium]